MRAKHHWLTLSIGGFLLAGLGCRGTQSLRSFVQVRKETNADVAPFDAPNQRLATTKPRAGSPNSSNEGSQSIASKDGSAVRVEISSDSQPRPEVDARTLAMNASQSVGADQDQNFRTHRPEVPTIQNVSASEPAKAHLSSNVPVTASLEDRRHGMPQTRASDKPIRSIAKSSDQRKVAPSERAAMASLSDLPSDADADEMLKAFRDSPPQVQEQAMRQLVAALARTADKSAQPAALDRVLSDSLDALPELPGEVKKPATVPPNRLASGSKKSDSHVESAGVPSKSEMAQSAGTSVSRDTQSREVGATASSSTTESTHGGLEPAVVQAVTNEKQNHQSGQATNVLPASAARDSQAENVVEQAAVVTPAIGTDAGALTDQALYDALLQRLSVAPPNETESERSRRLIMARHLMVLAGDPDRAVAEIEDMSEKEQEYLRHQLLGLWTIIDPDGHPVPARRFTTALPQLREATKYLAAATDSLEVKSLAFCTEIESYGQIKTFPGNRFESGQQVILYCEIENFTVSDVDSGFETHLQGSYDIYNEQNDKVVSQLLPADKQVSSNYLRDYFIAYQMYLPKQLQKGSYRLQLTMEDVAGKKYGQASIPLEIK